MRLFQIIMIVLITGINFYVWMRIWQMLPPNAVMRTVMVSLAILLSSSFILYFLLIGMNVPVAVMSVIYKVGTSWFFIMLYLLMLFLMADILRLVGLKQLNFLMRDNLYALAGLAVILGTVFTVGYLNYRHKARTEVNMVLNKALGKVPSLKVVGISDLHLGYGIGTKELSQWVELINAESPDVVLIAGDMIDSDTRPLEENRFWEVLEKIESRYGIYMVLGNHEYISGIEKSLSFIEKTPVVLLRDSSVLIDESFYIVGRDDRTNTKRKTIGELTAELDNSKPVLMLDHQPYSLEVVQNAKIDVLICGHTHRGQIWPINWITDSMYEDSYGLLRKGATNIYVSSGIGIWGGKFRLGSKSEYLVMNISGKEE